jgi:hypothetical protein
LKINSHSATKWQFLKLDQQLLFAMVLPQSYATPLEVIRDSLAGTKALDEWFQVSLDFQLAKLALQQSRLMLLG